MLPSCRFFLLDVLKLKIVNCKYSLFFYAFIINIIIIVIYFIIIIIIIITYNAFNVYIYVVSPRRY